ncbi:MAG TPA: hypothetical protein PKL49_11915 [Steroidobacteraceae bacterium]|nr:hypothetical protein [Steroidobacteraceae bacterium]HNS26675.1 hypothetical protein [Steroidobacteraceae bacterium]
MKALLALIALAALPLAVPAADDCAGRSHCVATRSFVADVTNFRVSKSGRYRVLTATVNFRNRTDKPLTLGYVGDSGIAMDEQGNRYVVANAQAVRGIGLVSGSSFDPKFTLQPGEASDTRFELVWDPGKAIVGVSYELDLAIREINAVTPDQFRLGSEHSVHFSQLAEGAASAAPVGANAAATGRSAPAAPAAATPAAIAADPCAGSTRCYNAGPFIAEVVQLTSAAMGSGVRHHSVALNIRFRNVSDRPIILGYHSGSSAGIDNFGNTYYRGRAGTHDTSVKGIGYVDGRSADTQFALAPGQSRNATFNLIRYEAKPPIGNAWGYDVVIDELEILPGQQVRTVRENSLNFQNLTAGTFAGTATNPADGAAAAQDVASQVIGLFKKLKDK